jgi:hypothetical protein
MLKLHCSACSCTQHEEDKLTTTCYVAAARCHLPGLLYLSRGALGWPLVGVNAAKQTCCVLHALIAAA